MNRRFSWGAFLAPFLPKQAAPQAEVTPRFKYHPGGHDEPVVRYRDTGLEGSGYRILWPYYRAYEDGHVRPDDARAWIDEYDSYMAIRRACFRKGDARAEAIGLDLALIRDVMVAAAEVA